MNIKQLILLGFAWIASFQVLKSQDRVLPENQILDRIVAVVGNQIVLQSEVEEQYLQMQARGLSMSSNQKCEIFEQLLFQKLLVVQAQIDSVEVTDKQVEAEINDRLEKFIRQAGSPEALEEYFGKSITEIKESFYDPVKDQLIASKMQGEITKDLKITPSEVKKFFASMNPDSLPIVEATYEFAQIVKKPQMTDEEKKMQRNKLSEIKTRILNGDDFKTMAILYSDDPGSAKNGGLMTGVSRGDLVPEFASAAFNLEIGEISDIVETEYGIHIIKLEGRHGDRVDFRHILLIPRISSQAKLQAKNYLDSLANVIRTDTLTFAQAAILYSEDETTRLNGGLRVNPYNGTTSFEAKYIEPAVTYVLRDLKTGEISEPFESKEETGIGVYKILLLKNYIKEHTLNMKDDYQLIQDMAMDDKKQKEVLRWVRDKQKDMYIKIEGQFRNCTFDFPDWLKTD
jgi:peptidyl-prolyl cis-trans isomerase SurA